MRTLAILPVKSFADAKQRLAHELDPGSRRALTEAMFSDVLIALRRARLVDRVLVVTADPGAQQIAGGHGAHVLEREDRGHNDAAAAGIEHALEEGSPRALLVPGDTPLLNPAELDQLLERERAPRSVAIVPDRHGTGTNALLLTPPNALAPAFGADSRIRHVSLAGSYGVDTEVVEIASLALDVDTSEDLAALEAALASSHGGAAHTRGMLRQLMRSRS